MPSEITLDEVRRQAADIGLTRLNDEQLKEMLRATRAARERSAALPTADLTPADEPAHVYSVERSPRMRELAFSALRRPRDFCVRKNSRGWSTRKR